MTGQSRLSARCMVRSVVQHDPSRAYAAAPHTHFDMATGIHPPPRRTPCRQPLTAEQVTTTGHPSLCPGMTHHPRNCPAEVAESQVIATNGRPPDPKCTARMSRRVVGRDVSPKRPGTFARPGLRGGRSFCRLRRRDRHRISLRKACANFGVSPPRPRHGSARPPRRSKFLPPPQKGQTPNFASQSLREFRRQSPSPTTR